MMLGTNVGTNETWTRIPSGSVGVELGVWKGDSSEKFLRRASHLHLVDAWSVEPYKDGAEHGSREEYLNRYAKITGGATEKDFESFYEKVYRGVEKRFKDSPVTIWRMTTGQFFREFVGMVDWVYVDASHEYEDVMFDLTQSLTIVKPEGVIFGDDFTNKSGVNKAVKEFCEQFNLSYDNFFQNQYSIQL